MIKLPTFSSFYDVFVLEIRTKCMYYSYYKSILDIYLLRQTSLNEARPKPSNYLFSMCQRSRMVWKIDLRLKALTVNLRQRRR